MTRTKLNNRHLKDDILKLREEGKSYRDIASLLNCSKSVISYHCNGGSTKLKVNSYHKNKDTKTKAIVKKLNGFKSRHVPKLIKSKTAGFKRTTSRTKTIVNNITEGNYTSKDVLNKIGANPKCYLTGEPIDLYATDTYEFDHIVPIKLGGTNDLSNLQICLKEANKAKGELMLKDFYELCTKVLLYKDFKNDSLS
jgi:5-methylcytosine-specific restriction endonuclease McrA